MKRLILLFFEILGFAALGVAVLMFLARMLESEGDRVGVPMFLMLVGAVGFVILIIYGAVRLFGGRRAS